MQARGPQTRGEGCQQPFSNPTFQQQTFGQQTTNSNSIWLPPKRSTIRHTSCQISAHFICYHRAVFDNCHIRVHLHMCVCPACVCMRVFPHQKNKMDTRNPLTGNTQMWVITPKKSSALPIDNRDWGLPPSKKKNCSAAKSKIKMIH